MNRDTGMPVRELRADGGACANNFLMQFQTDILGIPVVRPKLVETTAVGAAYLAGLGSGFWCDSKELEGAWQRDRGFSPGMGATERERLYTGWKRAVSQVRSNRRDESW